MKTDNVLTIAIFTVFILTPFVSVWLENQIDKAKIKIDQKLAPHGLRLKR